MVQVLTHWACAKISASGDLADAALLAALDDRLHGQPAIRSCPGAAAVLPCLRLHGAYRSVILSCRLPEWQHAWQLSGQRCLLAR